MTRAARSEGTPKTRFARFEDPERYASEVARSAHSECYFATAVIPKAHIPPEDGYNA